jgi:uncharacterized protein YgiM (DUF1202 family)
MSENRPALSSRLMALIFGAALIALALPVSKALACACCETYAVTGVASWDTLNVRSGPGTGFQIIRRLPHNESCITMTGERQSNWVRINANMSGATGWVNAKHLAFRRTAAPDPGNDQYRYLACVTGVRANDVLNIRSGRSGNSPTVGMIPPGESGVEVYQDVGSWSHVRYGGVTGWVANRFLDPRC